ncbi:(2Fe-2S)-binding protein [Actinomadura sp. BRA 177]|uniref:(2Fe-2S)-binding protein n=1 Tax=Actinomadura sp. BRA 177 TaxID=2745202 RepID=UPI0015959A62|nr:(2Fe-2S)-binding protein [Actinomadura sp. BRA 177]NVI90487.1 (2Fe-2S)-binding protein [Actinomadura sp. BRA 177]
MPSDVASDQVAGVLRDVGRLGPYFEIRTELDGAGWRPFAGDVRRLRALTGDYAERLGAKERRVSASLVFQGLAARLWSPVVAAAAGGIVPDLRTLRWRWAPGEAITLGLDKPGGWRVEDTAEAAALVHDVIVDGHLRPLREIMASFVNLADGLVWGNAASALVGSLHVGPADAVRGELVRELLRREPLAGAGEFRADGFVRKSCCLYYRVPGGGMCGDCGLLPGS